MTHADLGAPAAAISHHATPTRALAVGHHDLGRRWTRVARTGDCVRLTNVGRTPVILSGIRKQVLPGRSAFHVRLAVDLSARALEGAAQVVVEVTPGLHLVP